MATVLVEDQVEIPGTVATLTAFRHWVLSESFPKRGRIDWVGSQIEVDMSPEDMFTHGTLKTEIVRVLGAMAKNKGYNLFTGETRISSVGKDRRRLPPAYFAAGVTEFWLVDARGPELDFVIHHRAENGFVQAPVAADGGQPSTVFSCGFRLIRGPVGGFNVRELTAETAARRFT